MTLRRLGEPICPQVRPSVHRTFYGANPVVTADGTYNPFPSFEYTGSLRPAYPLSAKRAVPAHIPRPDYVTAGGKRFTPAHAHLAPRHPTPWLTTILGKPLGEIQAAGQSLSLALTNTAM